MLNLKDKNLLIFKQFGFMPKGKSSSQVYGDCLFCGRENKFFVNASNKKWDCKVCGKSGGYQMFLQEMVEFCQTNFTRKN